MLPSGESQGRQHPRAHQIADSVFVGRLARMDRDRAHIVRICIHDAHHGTLRQHVITKHFRMT